MTADVRQDRPEWLTEDGVIDAAKVPCPCCGELPWCRAEVGIAAAGLVSAPEILVGTATYRGGRSR